MYHAQRHFDSGATRPSGSRREMLTRLELALTRWEGELLEALKADLNKSPYEGYMSELGPTLAGFAARRHLKSDRRPAPCPLSQFLRGRCHREALRRVADPRPVELPPVSHPGPPGVRHRGGVHRGGEAGGGRPCLRPRPGGGAGAGVSAGVYHRGRGGTGGGGGPGGQALRRDLLHRQSGGGEKGHGRGGGAPHPRHPGAGGQVAGDSGPRRRCGAGRGPHCLGQVPQRGADLRGPGPCMGSGGDGGALCGRPGPADHPFLR